MSLNDLQHSISRHHKSYTSLTGRSFYIEFFQLSLASGASIDSHVSVPSNVIVKSVEFTCQHDSNGPVRVQLYEDCDVTQGSTERKGFCYNRNKDNIPQLKVFEDSTINQLGELISERYALGDASASSVITFETGVREMKKGSDYIQRITNQGGGSTSIVTLFAWAEE